MRILFAALLLGAAACAAAQGLKPWPGGATPPLALRDLAGREHRLQDYRGKVVLVNFWATWCEPCREEMPSMKKLRASLAGRPFEVLAVNLGEPEARIRRFLETVPLDFPVLLDRDATVIGAYNPSKTLPYTVVIDRSQQVVHRVSGYTPGDEVALSTLVTQLVGGGTTR